MRPQDSKDAPADTGVAPSTGSCAEADAGPGAETAAFTAPDDFSPDQAAAAALIAAALAPFGVVLGDPGRASAPADDLEAEGGGPGKALAVLGKAGSGKTHLLAWLVGELEAAGLRQASAEPEARKKKRRRGPRFAVVAPTNKAASVLRGRGAAASTIHRILYSPVYDPEYETLIQWLAEPEAHEKPAGAAGLTPEVLDRALAVFRKTGSAPAALASVGVRGSEFITGWKRRDERIAIGLVDEASMIEDAQLDDLRAIFSLVILFGDPAQLAPVGQSGEMAFDKLPAPSVRRLARVHRQEAGNPIIDLAYALQEDISFEAFEAAVREASERDDRVIYGGGVNTDLLARSPALVWRNATRVRLIQAFRRAHELTEAELAPGEPLICDGLELSAKHRNRRIDLEQAGLVKGAQAFWLGPGKQHGMARVHVSGAPQPVFGVAAIIQIEAPGLDEPYLPLAARQGAIFVHGAASTIHKAQGGQWPTVQVFAPDLFAAARFGKVEAGTPLWRRLAYVAVTRAEERLVWATRASLSRPKQALTAEDLTTGPLL